MAVEHSAGGIIYRKTRQGTLRFLLIFSARNKIWGFPKGHIESGETEHQAALREIKEETGLKNISVTLGFREEDVYCAISHRGKSKGRSIEKHSIYFLYETQEAAITVDNREIVDYKWVSIAAAMSLIGFASLQSILQKAYDRLLDQGA
jgi:bis(5'-nucleosidyl)-tetraphosphatase